MAGNMYKRIMNRRWRENAPKDLSAWEYVWKDEKETKWKPYFWIGKWDRTEQNRAL